MPIVPHSSRFAAASRTAIARGVRHEALARLQPANHDSLRGRIFAIILHGVRFRVTALSTHALPTMVHPLLWVVSCGPVHRGSSAAALRRTRRRVFRQGPAVADAQPDAVRPCTHSSIAATACVV
jgi:hypothetical protein